MDKIMELWDILDKEGNKLGKTIKRGEPLAEGEYHLVIDVWIMNNEGKFLISRRTPFKHPDPGKWNPVCGSAISGEDSISSALRETKEELGISLDIKNGKLVKRLLCGSKIIVDVWLFTQNVNISTVSLQEEETDDVMWATAETVKQMIDNDDFIHPKRVPYVDELFSLYIKI